MAALGYLCLQGLPFARPGTPPPAGGSPSGALPQAAIRGGLVFDLNLAASAAGVMLGSPLSQARLVCPDLVSVPVVEAVYQERLRSFMSALLQETSRYEFDGPNSLFIDFAGSGEPIAVLQRLLDAYAGFAIIAGIGSSKFVARAAALAAKAAHTYHRHPMYWPKPSPPERRLIDSGDAPPAGAAGSPGQPAHRRALRLVDLLAGGIQTSRSFLSSLPVGYLWPASEERRERLYRLGIRTCGELAAMDRQELCRVFGPDGGQMLDWAWGRDPQAVRPAYTPEEMVRRLDFEAPLAGKITLRRAAALLGEDLGRALIDEGLGCRTLVLTLYWSQGGTKSVSRAFSRPRGEPSALSASALSLLDKLPPEDEVSGMELAAQGVEQACGEQVSFIARAVGQSGPDPTLLRTLSCLERRFPGGAVRVGPPPASRRELMLQLVDPLRWQEGGRATTGATAG